MIITTIIYINEDEDKDDKRMLIRTTIRTANCATNSTEIIMTIRIAIRMAMRTTVGFNFASD